MSHRIFTLSNFPFLVNKIPAKSHETVYIYIYTYPQGFMELRGIMIPESPLLHYSMAWKVRLTGLLLGG